ncbi:hypothetical protein D9M69_510270 [compost metagenome]
MPMRRQPASGSSRAQPSCSSPHGNTMPSPKISTEMPDCVSSRRSWPGCSGRGSSARPMPSAGSTRFVSSQVSAPKPR